MRRRPDEHKRRDTESTTHARSNHPRPEDRDKPGSEEIRRGIRDAMQRLIRGTPVRSDGKLTVKSLAAEAGVKRWQLTHKHTDLQDEFRALVRQNGKTPIAFEKTVAKNKELKARVHNLVTDLKQARAELARYARVVQVLELENAALQSEVDGLSQMLAAPRTERESN